MIIKTKVASGDIELVTKEDLALISLRQGKDYVIIYPDQLSELLEHLKNAPQKQDFSQIKTLADLWEQMDKLD